MSSVLRPVGPEPRERYWVRRLAVLVAAVVAVGIVIALVGNALSAGSAVQAEPAPPTVAPVTLPPVTPSASPTDPGTAGPTPSESPTPAADTTPGTSASPTPGDVVTPDPGQTAKTERSTAPTATDQKQAEQQAAEKKAAAKKASAKKAAAKKKASAKKQKAAPVLAACPASDVRSTLTGPRKAKATKPAAFALSLINGSGKPCYVKVTGANFRLTVVSGKDRIWSSEDCPAAVPTSSRKLAAEKSVAWKMTWNGHRSAPGCKNRSEKPKPGYYWAIASFDDAKEVRWRIILT